MPPPPGPPPIRRISPVRIVVGLLLVAPAGIACLIGYVWPSLRTVWMSLHQISPFGPGETPDEIPPELAERFEQDGYVGFDHYERVVQEYDNPIGSLAFLLSLAVLPVLILVVVAPLLAWAAAHAGRAGRWTVRLALALPMVCFAPAALAAGWAVDRGIGSTGDVRTAVWLSMVGLVCGVGVTCYLAALRAGRVRAAGPRWAAAGTVAGLATITAVAVAVSMFTYPYVIRGGPDTLTPMLRVYRSALDRAEYGLGAAHAVLTLLPLMLLGLVAAAVVIATRLRVEVDDPEQPAAGWTGTRVAALAGAGLGAAAVLAVAAYGLWPWLSRPGFGTGPAELPGPPVGTILASTWLPPLVSTVVGVGLAAVAAFGIGALRPLGRWSELLLLPFAPWLFVGVGPLVVAKFDAARTGPFERLDSFLGEIPPIWLVVPALVLFTLLFRGLATGGRPYPRILLWALPMVALVAGATWLVQAQSLLWSSLIFSLEPAAPAWLLRMGSFLFAGEDVGFGVVLPVPLVAGLALGLMALQLFYLDRLAIRVGRE